jgi:hypothetical protein
MTEINLLDLLKARIIEISTLTLDTEKKATVVSLLTRYTTELSEDLSKASSEEEIKKCFNHYINNVLSILETLSGSSFKSIRRLTLNEIHGAKEAYINGTKPKS